MDEATLNKIVSAYARTGNVHKVAEEVPVCHSTVHDHLTKLGLIEVNNWTDEELAELIKIYQTGFLGGDGVIERFVKKTGRSKTCISRKARKLGLKTNKTRKSSGQTKQKLSKIKKKHFQENDHPRGALGMVHSKETKEKLSKKSKEQWETITPKQLRERYKKFRNTRRQNVDSGVTVLNQGGHSRTKSGKRKDLDNMFFRSAAESNYARYLKYIAKTEFEYEQKTFHFDKIKRGIVSYKPDFYIPREDKYHEFKGWLDPKSVTRLRRFRVYYPEEFKKLILVKQSLTKKDWVNINKIGFSPDQVVDFKSIEEYKAIIPHWE